jgi:class 3 adenylate cyclase
VTSVGPQTRGFLFADLRGYTRYTEDHGDAAAAALVGRYRTLVRGEIAAFHGAEIRTEGDSFYVVFGSVSEAVQAGLAIRDAASAASHADLAPIHVGIGIHAGEATDGEHGIVSSAVNIAARVCAVAAPGEVLVTDTVRALTRTFLTISFKPRGRHRLKGIAEPIALFHVEATDPNATRTSPLRGIRPAILVGGGLTVLLVLVASTLFRGPSESGGPPLGNASPSSVASAAVETHDLSDFADQGEFPNDAETALMDRMTSAVTADCARADRELIPAFWFPDSNLAGPTLQLGVRAGVSCLSGLNRVIVWQASSSPGGADELFFSLVLKRSVDEGSCETQSRVYASWSAGAHTGHVMCYINAEGSAVLEWSYAAANIYAIATRRDGSSRELYRWWLDVGRLMSR